VVEQGTHKSPFRSAVLPRLGEPRTNLVTYRLYRRLDQEHITPTEHIPSSASQRVGIDAPPHECRAFAFLKRAQG
jgi:hypothetical protein